MRDTNLVDGITGEHLKESLQKDIASLENKHLLSTGREVYNIGKLLRFKKMLLISIMKKLVDRAKQLTQYSDEYVCAKMYGERDQYTSIQDINTAIKLSK